jgi:hypothetical protein
MLYTVSEIIRAVIQYTVNPPEVASVAASFSQCGNSSTHKVACTSPLDTAVLSATTSITLYTLYNLHIFEKVSQLQNHFETFWFLS